MSKIRAWAALQAGGKLEPFEYDPGPLGAEDVEIAVVLYGFCDSGQSLLSDDCGMTRCSSVPLD